MIRERLEVLGFQCHDLGDGCEFFQGRLPPEIGWSPGKTDALWNLHPSEYHEIKIHGRLVKTPRWQQAYGEDYHYTGRTNEALPVPPLLGPLSQWCQTNIDAALNGILLNWYDADFRHYIGAHRDSTVNMTPDTPIVTISFGASRVFRLRPWKSKKAKAQRGDLPAKLDFAAADGTVFVTPYATNLAWTHEVPHFARDHGRRVSVTLRAFDTVQAS